MSLKELPSIERLTLAWVTRVPTWHPGHVGFEPFPVHAWLVRHPDGAILVDAGIGDDSDAINGWYSPTIVGLTSALATAEIDIADVAALVVSHLHFDHCGQQRLLDAPVFVQASEHREAQQPDYTIEEWAAVPAARLRLLDGDEQIADGVRVIATPGHSPGHQSVVVEGGGRRVVLGGQCAFRASELRTGEPAPTNLHDASWRDAARDSLAHLRALGPATTQLSHDPELVQLL